jgi:hypothetical protein
MRQKEEDMKAKSGSNWLVDALVIVGGMAAIMATGGSLRAMPVAPVVGCQAKQGGIYSQVAVLRPNLTTVWFQGDTAVLTDAGARSLLTAAQSYQPGDTLHLQILGTERPNRPSDHVAIDRVAIVSSVLSLHGVPAKDIAIQPAEQQIGCAS